VDQDALDAYPGPRDFIFSHVPHFETPGGLCRIYVAWRFESQKVFFRRWFKDEEIGKKDYNGSEEAKKLLRDHTVEVRKVST
jgi:hypothetical protein